MSSFVSFTLPETIRRPLARERVENCVMLYFGRDGALRGMRHIRGQEAMIDLSIRRLVADAVAFDARMVVMAHNHPSGDPTPSEADLAFTCRLARGFEAIGTRLCDHLVVAAGGATSLRAAGYL